jgi:energy-coupling factor transport system substrate-specific component
MSTTIATPTGTAAAVTPGPARSRAARPRLRIAVLVVANVVGILAFVWPLLLPLAAGADEDHRVDGPLILAGLVACVGLLLFVELGRGGLGPKTIALLGVLGAAMVALRLPGFILGFTPMFLVVLIAGNAFGPGFGFLLGAVGMLASGLFVGGLGPWLPFAMVAVGWVGMGAGFLPHHGDGASTKVTWRLRIGALAAYGFAAGLVYGAVMDLWEWPFIAGGSAIAWEPSAGAGANLHHFVTYYLATSLPFDLPRAIGNVVMVVLLGRPLLAALDRAARRMNLHVQPPSRAPADSIGG